MYIYFIFHILHISIGIYGHVTLYIAYICNLLVYYTLIYTLYMHYILTQLYVMYLCISSIIYYTCILYSPCLYTHLILYIYYNILSIYVI